MSDLDAIIAAGGPWKRAVRIGDQLLIEGDCREVMAVLPKVDAVVTDRKGKGAGARTPSAKPCGSPPACRSFTQG